MRRKKWMLQSLTLRGLLAFILLQSGDAILSVPGPVSSASLESLGADSFRVSFDPPASDGGSDITSYLVEWDTKAGVSEVQTIQTQISLDANEIQTITTTAIDINEVQILQSSATPQGEVQAVTVSPPPGEVALDSLYHYSLKLDTSSSGGDIQYSGQISATADASGSHSSLAEIIGAMSNVDDTPQVSKSNMNSNGGFTYLITFPTSMRNVPELEVYVTDVPVSINTIEEANLLQGHFNLEYDGEVTDLIPIDASESELYHALISLSTIHDVKVSRSDGNDQNGYTWRIEFTSDQNGGNLDDIIVHSENVSSSRSAAGAKIELVSGGTDGSFLSGSFVVHFENESSAPIPFNASPDEMKKILQDISSIGPIDVSRDGPSQVGGYNWDISFLENVDISHHGDVPEMTISSSLVAGDGADPQAIVTETRKGTFKEVQRISISAGGISVDPSSSFKLEFNGETTGDILALPINGSTCLGSTASKQLITTSTEDTSSSGGDESVSILTEFTISYKDYTTKRIYANVDSCTNTAAVIEYELSRLPPLNRVVVSGEDNVGVDGGCKWEVTLLSITGNPELFQVTAFHEDLVAGPGSDVIIGVAPSIIRDRIVVSQPDEFKGDINLIQAELSKLNSIGEITVSAENEVPDQFLQCSWKVTFESKAGDILPLRVAASATDNFSATATLVGGDVIAVQDDFVKGTSKSISGDFTLEFDGLKTPYLPHDVTATEMRAAIEGLGNTGGVSVNREGPDVNDCFKWKITFLDRLGDVPTIVVDGSDLSGTVPSITVEENVKGLRPPFNGPDYGSMLITDPDISTAVVSTLKQGIGYYVQVAASNALGNGSSILTTPALITPLPHVPEPPQNVYLKHVDASSVDLLIDQPENDWGEEIKSYKVEYSTSPFQRETQQITLQCSSTTEIQRVVTQVDDINEIQYLVVDSGYKGNGIVKEIQEISCDATGGEFGLTFNEETLFLDHGASEDDVKDALETMTNIEEVQISFLDGNTYACVQGGSRFTVTFVSMSGIDGNLPQLETITNQLEGARKVEITTVVDGDAPVQGSFSLSFRGSRSKSIIIDTDTSTLEQHIQQELENLDTLGNASVVVTHVPLSSVGSELVYSIEFTGVGVGGNVPAVEVVESDKHVSGTEADVFLLSDGDVFLARNGIDKFTGLVGNELKGAFQLRLRGHTTQDIPFNASTNTVKQRLESLPNIGSVDVTRILTNESEYSWTITFHDSPRNFDKLEVLSHLEGLRDGSSSASAYIEEVRQGSERLRGQFTLTFDDGNAQETTQPLDYFISALDLKQEIERLSNVGLVSVTRSVDEDGFSWVVEFSACDLKDSLDVCNDGDLKLLQVTNLSLVGCGGPLLSVTEITAGTTADPCPHLDGGLCSHVRTVHGNFPIHHRLEGLEVGQEYFVQARFRSNNGYSTRRLSSPESIVPGFNVPSAPPPVFLITSSATSITIGWETPHSTGGSPIYGYELYMDDLSGFESIMIHDGSGKPQIMEYTIETSDKGPLSQIVETGRQYRFKVRAMNLCKEYQSNSGHSEPCYGPFSPSQVYTVRDPRPPLPPPTPRRAAETGSMTDNTSISLVFDRPLDNGGSPITGYILYMKDSKQTTVSFPLTASDRSWTGTNLEEGEVYSFHLVALNEKGRSGNSPSLTVIAATYPGSKADYSLNDYHSFTRPSIVDVNESSMKIQWNKVHENFDGGSPVTGYKLFMYHGKNGNSAELGQQEIQKVFFTEFDGTVGGTFTLSYRGEETDHIDATSNSNDIKNHLENLSSIKTVRVSDIENGWAVTFVSEPGDLPLMSVTKGRLTGPNGLDLRVVEDLKGSDAIEIYDGSEAPHVNEFLVTNLIPGERYAFKVAPINSIGIGILSAESKSAIARSGASSSETTASGSSLYSGISGSIHEVQIVSFVSNDCENDGLFLYFLDNAESTQNLCSASFEEFEDALSSLSDVGKVHVSRQEFTNTNDVHGYTWSVTFLEWMGDPPLLKVHSMYLQNGQDASGKTGDEGIFVSELLKGRKNEFIIEPKKATGTVVRDVDLSGELQGKDIFFTEFWEANEIAKDGSHEWHSDGGVATYNPMRYEEQIVTVPKAIGDFVLSMNTSENLPNGRLGGTLTSSETMNGSSVNKEIMEHALRNMNNIGNVVISTTDNVDTMDFVVTFTSVYGEMPLFQSSHAQVKVQREDEMRGVTEIQTVTTSSDRVFVYETQGITLASIDKDFSLSFRGESTEVISLSTHPIENVAGIVQEQMNQLDKVKVEVTMSNIDTWVTGDPLLFDVFFFEPVGNLPLLHSEDVTIHEVVDGFTPLSGSFVLSYANEYTSDIAFDSSPTQVKIALESLPSIEEVDVKKKDMGTGYKWDITFTKEIGNLPNIVSHNNRFEVQRISSLGGYPTPLGGTFKLIFGMDETNPMPFDVSGDTLKVELEHLASVERVDVERVAGSNGQNDWLITFRTPSLPKKLEIQSGKITGTLDSFDCTIIIGGEEPSLISHGGEEPQIVVEEKVPGLPHYTADYIIDDVGSYSLAVLQLEKGGLTAWYYDNQWLSGKAAMKRIDENINFNWNLGSITEYGRDYVSVRWWGKLKPKTNEEFTFYLSVDDGARLYIDHVLLIDAWTSASNEEHKATFPLSSNQYHDIKLEYREETEQAHLTLFWSSDSIQKEIVPSDVLYHASHIKGSPYQNEIVAGAADYPYSEIIAQPNVPYNQTRAGEPTHFFIQARDAQGNIKSNENGLVMSDEQFVVEIKSEDSTIFGNVQYVEGGKFRVDYTILKAGSYTVHVRTGGTDIYCGYGEDLKCSPFSLDVKPGPTIASLCEVESVEGSRDYMVEARAGEEGKILIQARDIYGNSQNVQEEGFHAEFVLVNDVNIRFRGYVEYVDDGLYQVSYSIPKAGVYEVIVSFNGEAIRHCVGSVDPLIRDRSYDGISVYKSPSTCSSFLSTLTVVHNNLHPASSTVSDSEQMALAHATVGEVASFVIESRDSFGNIRKGSNTVGVVSSGDGTSDAFLVHLEGPSGYEVKSSSAVQIMTNTDLTIQGFFRLEFNGAVTPDFQHDVSPQALESILKSLLSPSLEVLVSGKATSIASFEWQITFINYLQEWSESPLKLVGSSDGVTDVINQMTLIKAGALGEYPISYTVWKTGTYTLSISVPRGEIVTGNTYTVEVDDGSLSAKSSIAFGDGIKEGIAGEQATFYVQTRDIHSPDIQSIQTIADSLSGTFVIKFNELVTNPIPVNAEAIVVKNALESLEGIGQVDVEKSNHGVCSTGASDSSKPCGVNIWIVTFAPLEGGCKPPLWDACPSNLGEIDPLEIDTSNIILTEGGSNINSLELIKIRSGSFGNNRTHDDSDKISFQLVHETSPGAVIGIDDIEYLGQGLHAVKYTPLLSGLYNVNLKVNDESLWGDFSKGVTITSSIPYAVSSYHNANIEVTVGEVEEFVLTALDRFGNYLQEDNSYDDYDFIVKLHGVPHSCSGSLEHDIRSLEVEESPEKDGRFHVTYIPMVAGQYTLSMMLRSKGGLLTSYFYNMDFTQPLTNDIGGNEPNVDWCPSGEYVCDSNTLSPIINFDWKNSSPLPEISSFPLDHFSIRWEGELYIPQNDKYKFSFKLDGLVRMRIGSKIVIDNMPQAVSDTVEGQLYLEGQQFYEIEVEYVHEKDESFISMFWESSFFGKQLLPKSNLYYTRHIGGSTSTPSPLTVYSSPGDIASTSEANGEGVKTCVASTICSFAVQTKDSYGNNRFTLGSDPNFEIEMIGVDSWAGKGRRNDNILSTSPINIVPLIQNQDWDFVATADVTHGSKFITSVSPLPLQLATGDSISIKGHLYTVNKDAKVSTTLIELKEEYFGSTESGIDIFKIQECESGTHVITYNPTVKGLYNLDIRLPKVTEVQLIQTKAVSLKPISGSFILILQNEDGDEVNTDEINFDATAMELENILQSLPSFEYIQVNRLDCVDPARLCSWEISFDGHLEGVQLIEAYWEGTLKNSDVRVTRLQHGRDPESITGVPTTVKVEPSDLDPSTTIAYGQGLKHAIAGEQSIFYIQPKDSEGNNIECKDQLNNFAVRVFSNEKIDGSDVDVDIENIANGDECILKASYVTTRSGHHTISVVARTMTEVQTIQTSFASLARGGYFYLSVGTQKTDPIPWNAKSEHIVTALEKLEDIGNVTVILERIDNLNSRYIVTFESKIGNVDEIQVDTIDLVGNGGAWTVTSIDGDFSHIMQGSSDGRYSSITNEIQQISITVAEGLDTSGIFLNLRISGFQTRSIPYNAVDQEIKDALESLRVVGAVNVSRFDQASGFDWVITFTPDSGGSEDGLFNYGPLPHIEVLVNHQSIATNVISLQEGWSPFRVSVSPAEAQVYNTYATDLENYPLKEVGVRGFYNKLSKFQLHLRDTFDNFVHVQPRSEVQILTTSSSSQMNGEITVSFLDSEVNVAYNVGPDKFQEGLRVLEGLGNPWVTSTSAKSKVDGKTLAIVQGSKVATPNDRLLEFATGDWIRIGSANSEYIFTITQMDNLPPFSIELSSYYNGPTLSAASIYRQSSPAGVHIGYQYIINFDPSVGDIPSLSVNGSALNGDNAQVTITACDENSRLELILKASNVDVLEGFLLLSFDDEETELISVDADASEISLEIMTSINAVDSIDVRELLNTPNEKRWELNIVTSKALSNFYADGRFVKCSANCPPEVEIQPICATSESKNGEDQVQSVFGIEGHDFAVSIEGEERKQGILEFDRDGIYSVSFETPSLGEYDLKIESVVKGGLMGEYFSNRWLYGEPVLTRLDEELDFYWSEEDPITVTGRDFVSVRWQGFIKPLFSEVYTLILDVNDGVKLWIDNELVLDEYDTNTPAELNHFTYERETLNRLRAGSLVPIKIEFRENRGDARIALKWKSLSQILEVIPSENLYSDSKPIDQSPFSVFPEALEPSEPRNCTLLNTLWNSLTIFWEEPNSTGGDSISKYLVEYWSNEDNVYGVPDIQILRFDIASEGSPFYIRMNGVKTYDEIRVGASSVIIKNALDALPGISRVSVDVENEEDALAYSITFLENPAPVDTMSIVDTTIESEKYCVCGKSSISCLQGSLSGQCSLHATQESTISTQRFEIPVTEAARNEHIFSYEIKNLLQDSSILDGFGARVSAVNSAGLGNPCSQVFMKPMAVPDPPSDVELTRNPSSPSSLLLYFTLDVYPQDRGSPIHSYVIESSRDPSFLLLESVEVPLDLLPSPRIWSYRDKKKRHLMHQLDGLVPGEGYYVRISAVNNVGFSTPVLANEEAFHPGSTPTFVIGSGSPILSQQPVALSSVAESSTSLEVSWETPQILNGFSVTEYLIEYWTTPGTHEVQTISLSFVGSVKGTFTLRYDGELTASLPVDVSAANLQSALEALSSLRAIHVDKDTGVSSMVWNVTFLSEYPSVHGKILEVNSDTELKDSSSNSSPALSIDVDTEGTLPFGYNSMTVPVTEITRYEYRKTLVDLIPGQEYFVQVSARNKLGYGKPAVTTPESLSPPIQKPDRPSLVEIMVNSKSSLKVSFTHPVSDGGDAITQYKIEWDTRASFDSNDGSPFGFDNVIISRGAAACNPCTYVISNLVTGTPYHVRVYAYNSFGYSNEAQYSTPLSETPKTTPDPPLSVEVIPYSDDGIKVKFPSSKNNGGQDITKYRLNWLSIPNDSSVDRSTLYYRQAVQSITLSSNAHDLSGYFYISFENHVSKKISVDATSTEMRMILQEIPTFGSIVVSKSNIHFGRKWMITFETNIGHNHYHGDLSSMLVSTVEFPLPSDFVEVTATHETISGTDVELKVTQDIQPLQGFEQQSIETSCSNSNSKIYGNFQISMNEKTSNVLPHDCTHDEMQEALESMQDVGKVLVSRKTSHGAKGAFIWTIVFLENLGDLPLLQVSGNIQCTDNSIGNIRAMELVSGELLLSGDGSSDFVDIDVVDNRNSYEYEVENLDPNRFYQVQVEAWNGFGSRFGSSCYALPVSLSPIGTPDAPSNLLIKSHNLESLELSWNPSPKRILKYNAQISCSNNTSSNLIINQDVTPMPEIQEITLSSKAEYIGGSFIVQFMGEKTGLIEVTSDAFEMKLALESLATIGTVDVTKKKDYLVTSWIVTFLDNVGDLPSLLVYTGTSAPSTVATGGTMQGLSTVLKTSIIEHGSLPNTLITPSLPYCESYEATVKAYNGYYWSKESKKSFQKAFTTQTPSAPRSVKVKILSDTQVIVQWDSPDFTGGLDISQYSIQWGADLQYDHKALVNINSQSQVSFSHVISNLRSDIVYQFRVSAYNANGFGPSTVAVVEDNLSSKATLVMMDTSQLPDETTSFVISLKYHDLSFSTEPLSIYATSQDVEDAINLIARNEVVSVTRVDESSVMDNSNIGTSFFKMSYIMSFYGNSISNRKGIEVTSNLGGIQISVDEVDISSGDISIAPRKTSPEGPRNIELSIISKTEIGVRWSPPQYDGGDTVTKYLVEWDTIDSFDDTQVSALNSYSNPTGPLSHSAVVTDTRYQIVGLDSSKEYFVRVSAYNSHGYSDAVSSTPKSVTTTAQPLYLPSDVKVSTSLSDIQNRLNVQWTVPLVDEYGFSITPASCGLDTGHTPELATSYVITWGTNPTLNTASTFEAHLEPSDSCCPGSECSIELGTEVQRITLHSPTLHHATQGGMKILYLGPQGKSLVVKTEKNSNEIEIISHVGVDRITVGDYIRIGDFVSLVKVVTETKLTTDQKYFGPISTELIASYSSPPSTCFDVVNGDKVDLKSHIMLNFDHSPLNEDIEVTIYSSKTEKFFEVSFVGPSFVDETTELVTLWNDGYCDYLENSSALRLESSVTVETMVDSGSIKPGKAYFVEVAAKNSVGIGPRASSNPSYMIPKSSPHFAQECQVSALSHESDQLLVTWLGVHPYSGEDPLSYDIEFYKGDSLEKVVTLTEIDESKQYSITQSGFTPGERFKVLIVPANSIGASAPIWYGSKRVCVARPVCLSRYEECVESNDEEILVRSVPDMPTVSISSFTKDTATVSIISTNNYASVGETITSYRFEWSTDSSFLKSEFEVTSALSFQIPSLTMGKLYYVRAQAYNSAGYSYTSEVTSFKPMQSSDAPYSPVVNNLFLSSYVTTIDRGTSLEVSWKAPRIDAEDGRPDTVGNGGDNVSSYLVEWSEADWNSYGQVVWKISANTISTDLSGYFTLRYDSSSNLCEELQQITTSVKIPIDVSEDRLETHLENMFNIGDVDVTQLEPFTWEIVFLDIIGTGSNLEISDSKVLDENEDDVFLSISKQTESTVPSDSTYQCTSTSNLSLSIESLTPGVDYFVRVSAGNSLGYGSRRRTAPASLATPIQKPLEPRSKYHQESAPALRRLSEKEILVEFGPPIFDGGSEVVSYLIEWDTSSDFKSPLGRERVMATNDSFVIDSLSPNTRYFVRVASENKVLGTGPFTLCAPSSVVTDTFPSDLTSVDISILSKSSLHIEWTIEENVDNYIIEIRAQT